MPDEDSRVGIGVGTVAGAKLHVFREVASGTANYTGLFEMFGSDGHKTSARMVADGSGAQHFAGQGLAYDATSDNSGLRGQGTVRSGISNTNNQGVHGFAEVKNGGASDHNSGMHAEATITTSATAANNYGLRVNTTALGATTNNFGIRSLAQGSGATTGYGIWARSMNASNNWAAWLEGNVTVTGIGYIPGGTWQPSDETLKTNIQPLEGASDVLAQFNAKTFEFLVEEHPNAGLPPGFQAGLMIQQVQGVLPHLVRDITIPELLDDEGNMVHPAETLQAMNYTGIIPYLIAAFNEQATRLDQLEAQLGDCCSQMIQGGDLRGMEPAGPAPGERLLTIVPNPVSEFTAIGYTLERGGRVMLLLTGSDGRQMDVLHEAHLEAGQYQHDWHTAQLAAGVYHITLLLDGEPLVKRAVKL